MKKVLKESCDYNIPVKNRKLYSFLHKEGLDVLYYVKRMDIFI